MINLQFIKCTVTVLPAYCCEITAAACARSSGVKRISLACLRSPRVSHYICDVSRVLQGTSVTPPVNHWPAYRGIPSSRPNNIKLNVVCFLSMSSGSTLHPQSRPIDALSRNHVHHPDGQSIDRTNALARQMSEFSTSRHCPR